MLPGRRPSNQLATAGNATGTRQCDLHPDFPKGWTSAPATGRQTKTVTRQAEQDCS